MAVLRLINRVRSLLIHDIQERKTNSFRKNSIGTHKQSSKITKSRENTLITKNWRNRPIGDQRTARYGSVRTLLIFMTGYFSSNKNFGPLILGKRVGRVPGGHFWPFSRDNYGLNISFVVIIRAVINNKWGWTKGWYRMVHVGHYYLTPRNHAQDFQNLLHQVPHRTFSMYSKGEVFILIF